MESVRWLRGATPGANSIMRKTVPLARVVPTLRVDSSAWPLLFTGNPSVVHTTQDVAPGRPEIVFEHTSSILTIAFPLASWPVITRRTLSAITLSSHRHSRMPVELSRFGRGLGPGNPGPRNPGPRNPGLGGAFRKGGEAPLRGLHGLKNLALR